MTRREEIVLLQAEYALLMAKRKFADASRVFGRLKSLMMRELNQELSADDFEDSEQVYGA